MTANTSRDPTCQAHTVVHIPSSNFGYRCEAMTPIGAADTLNTPAALRVKALQQQQQQQGQGSTVARVHHHLYPHHQQRQSGNQQGSMGVVLMQPNAVHPRWTAMKAPSPPPHTCSTHLLLTCIFTGLAVGSTMPRSTPTHASNQT
jgi:hypothetical protein